MNSIKFLVMDVDGTLTDGRIYIGAEGEIIKAFDVKDGFAIANILPMHNIVPVIITGRYSKIVENRAEELGISMIYQGVYNKLEILKNIINEYNVSEREIAYIGDDVNDLECLMYAGLSACPKDASVEVKNIVDVVLKNKGGRGAVREFIEIIISGRK